jgi:hypothetical protein
MGLLEAKNRRTCSIKESRGTMIFLPLTDAQKTNSSSGHPYKWRDFSINLKSNHVFGNAGHFASGYPLGFSS